MNKNLLIGAAVVLVIAIVGVLVVKKSDNGIPEANASSTTIQISAGQAYVLAENGDRSAELKNGDSLTPPVTIQVSENGAATVTFPDKSVARIQGGTTFTLKSADYDKTTGKANTSIFVKIGRVWSKVMELATPDSSWEVETQTSVATVRGTAFDTNVTAEGTVFAGSDDEVLVAPIDPATRSRVEAAAQTLGEGKKIEIASSVLADLIAGRTKLVVLELSATEKADGWFSGNERDDTSLDDANQQRSDGSGAGNESARGTLSDLWKSGKSQKCTYSFDYGQGKSEGTIYLADGKMRGDFVMKIAAGTADDMTVESHMVRDRDFTYVWSSASPQGFKMPTTDDLSGGGGDQSFDYNQMMDYNCSGWNADRATFSLPSNVTFTSFTVPAQR